MLQHAELLAAVQILVYAGGVMVLFLFVIMLVNVRDAAGAAAVPAAALRRSRSVVGGAAGGAGGRRRCGRGRRRRLADPAALAPGRRALPLGNTEAVGWSLYRDYLLPFEVVSIVLLVAMIGAIVHGSQGAGRRGA